LIAAAPVRLAELLSTSYNFLVPNDVDNQSERFARITALMEEYRIKHEDLEAYVTAVRDRARLEREKVRAFTDAVRAQRAKRTR
jgi:hypothetical protein